MGAPIFPHLSYGNYGTLSYSKSAKLGGIKLRRNKAVSEIANSTMGFGAKFSTFYILGTLSEN
jgi:hypothetical protein